MTQLPDKPSPFLKNLATSDSFYAALVLTFANPHRPSQALADAATKLRLWIAHNRPDVDQAVWIHSWQANSSMSEQRQVAKLLGF